MLFQSRFKVERYELNNMLVELLWLVSKVEKAEEQTDQDRWKQRLARRLKTFLAHYAYNEQGFGKSKPRSNFNKASIVAELDLSGRERLLAEVQRLGLEVRPLLINKVGDEILEHHYNLETAVAKYKVAIFFEDHLM
jgi:hypothetical protein